MLIATKSGKITAKNTKLKPTWCKTCKGGGNMWKVADKMLIVKIQNVNNIPTEAAFNTILLEFLEL